MSSSGFGLSSNGGSASQTASPLLSAANGGQSHCAMHDALPTDRSSGGSNSLGGTGSCVGVDNFSSGKITGGLSDCSVAAAAQSGKNRGGNDYENHSRKNNVGGASNNVAGQYTDFSARHMSPVIGPGSNADNSGGIAMGTSHQSHGHGGGGKNRMDMGIPDDAKLLANPKGIIKSYLPQAAAFDSQKFDAYRELCLAHADEYYKSQKGSALWAICHVCNTTLPHWNTLQRHLQTHIDFRPFVCEQCCRTFYSQSKLKRHQVIHSDVKPYKCPVCDRRLGRTEHLKRHLLVHTDDKPFSCSACTHTTKRLDGIRRHIKRKHGIGAAEIVVIASRADAQTLGDLRQVMSAIDESEQREEKPKKKKKKKKKKAGSALGENNQNNIQQQDMDAMNSKDYSGNLLEVAARFGLSDLRLPGGGSTTAESDRGFDSGSGGGGGGGGSSGGGGGGGSASTHLKEGGKNSFHEGSHGGRGGRGGGAENLSMDEMKPSWDGGLLLGGLPTQQMHLLYHSLARSHPAAAHTDNMSMGGGASSTPCNLSGGGSDAGSSSGNNLRQPAFCHDRGPMTSPADHTFIMNSSSMPMRYLPTVGAPVDNNAARHVNPMLFSPRNSTRNLGHFGTSDMNMPAEAMISQYIQSQQRFAPPVWGFTNPNYHNY